MDKKKSVGIIGAGFTGLAAAFKLAEEGINVTVIEASQVPGGLAMGFTNKKWKWSLESHYHHWFTNDDVILNLADRIGHKFYKVRPKTSTYINGKIQQLDSPVSLLLFDEIPVIDRLRTGIIMSYLKITNNWRYLEKISAKDFLISTMGKTSWKNLWEPLFVKKFGKYSGEVSAAWFWARIKKRTSELAYPEGGFDKFARSIEKVLVKKGIKINYGQTISSIQEMEKNQILIQSNKQQYLFDYVVSTIPFGLLVKVTKGLPEDYLKKAQYFKGIGVINLVLTLKRPFLADGSYWLNINDMKAPFLAVVEHTNFMDKKYYNNEHIVYIANYLDAAHPYFMYDKQKLYKKYLPFLKQINPMFKEEWVLNVNKFDAKFAQPIMDIDYSKKILPFVTPIENLYVCNMQQVYPWDRGTNYAVDLGFRVSDEIIRKEKNE